MAKQPDASEPQEEAPGTLLERARAWALGSRLRSAAVAGGLLGLMGVTVAVWLLLASWAAPKRVTSLETALERLDAGDLDVAANLVRRMQEEQNILTQDYGGPLFVLGAVRAKEAEKQWAPARRRRDYLVASRYLDEARSLGVPEDREFESLYLLGKSYIGSDQLEKGVDVLSEALGSLPERETEIHGLLAKAHYFTSRPENENYEQALGHLEQVLADPEAPDDVRSEALLRRARTLSRLGRHDDAEQAVANLPEEVDPAQAKLASGQILAVAAADEADPERRAEMLNRAEAALNEAAGLDYVSNSILGGVPVLLGRVDQLRGRAREALARFDSVQKFFGLTDAGVAASIFEGELLRLAGETNGSIDAYRQALEAVADMPSYQSELMPMPDLRASVLAAHDGYTIGGQFDAALRLLEYVEPLLGMTTQLELKAETQQRSGEWLLEQAESKSFPLPELQRQGRQRLREAGVSFEQLAEERFADVKYPDDLWRAAEAYYKGQSYSHAAQLLEDYLKDEPERYNAQALLRLGQTKLALGRLDEAIGAFEECILEHPNDAAVYGCRLAAAKAHRDLGRADLAEPLLRENLIGGTLSPRSPEWRDSKFELGMLLHESDRHLEAIDHLEEAIKRYPNAKQARAAQYMTAESYRAAAVAPRERFLAAKAVNEREENEREFQSLLNEALKHYTAVQREISRSGSTLDTDIKMLRNCYMLKGSVLFDLERYREAVDEFSNVSALYQNDPFVLETLLQISYCWRRLGDPTKARGNIEQAILALGRMPADADFLTTTSRNRAEWESLLNNIRNL